MSKLAKHSLITTCMNYFEAQLIVKVKAKHESHFLLQVTSRAELKTLKTLEQTLILAILEIRLISLKLKRKKLNKINY